MTMRDHWHDYDTNPDSSSSGDYRFPPQTRPGMPSWRGDPRTEAGANDLLQQARMDAEAAVSNPDTVAELCGNEWPFARARAAAFMEQSICLPRELYHDQRLGQWVYQTIRSIYTVEVYRILRAATHGHCTRRTQPPYRPSHHRRPKGT